MSNTRQRWSPRILVTGATGFLGYQVVGALLDFGVTVTALVQPDRQDVLDVFEDQVQLTVADVWNRASLKGRARNHDVVLHLVGSPRVDPQRGLTYDHVNLVSARHVIAMAVGDGVPHVVLLSTVVRPLELPGAYVRSKRDAELYLRGCGLNWTIVRAPALFAPRRNPLLSLMAVVGTLLPLRLLTGRHAPLRVDVAANGIAGLAFQAHGYANRVVYANTLRREARKMRRLRRQGIVTARSRGDVRQGQDTEDVPFGWLPPK